jgi:uncharacterized protein
MKKTLTSLLIKPSGPDCNLNCNYCFYLEKSEMFPQDLIHRMSLKVLENMIKQALEQGSYNISFGWQGGEPTLMGLPFFKKVVEYQLKYGSGKTIGNGLQTNGILLTPEWARFLSKYRFLVGLSLDGPEHIHDYYRVTKNGKGTWKKVHEKAKMLLDMGVDTNALVVVNDYSVEFPEEIYAYHKDLGLKYMQFIPCVENDNSIQNKIAPFSVSAVKYGEFLNKIFNLWYADIKDGVEGTSVRYFDSVFYKYVGLEAPDCTLAESCGTYLVVEYNGDVYSCDFFVENDWKLGNISSGKLSEMLNSEKQDTFGKLKADLPTECITCKWLKKCRGGCTKDRVRNLETPDSNYFCESYKIFFEHADEKLSALAEQWKNNQPRY